ncbi:MAG: Gfo/Idh/MocA family oxidoreductase [Acetobacter sp.]|nr:Gfo/Idh/MocA family oxidoreductase [Acetobacter sp.]
MENKVLRVGIIGAGHFGRYHALKIGQVPQEILSGLFDPNAQQATKVAAEANCLVAESVEQLLAWSDAVVIAAPAQHHFDLSIQALQAGKHVLIEKPIAETLEQADRLTALACESGLVCQVGHLLRYSAEYEAITQHMLNPLYIEATRIAPYTQRGTDVSVILDLMIHDLDLILAIVNHPVAQVDAVGAAVSSQCEDIANARVRFENGCVATMTASRISLKTERRMRFFSEEKYLSVDFMKRELSVIEQGRGEGLSAIGQSRIRQLGLDQLGLRHWGTKMNPFRRDCRRWHERDSLFEEHKAFVASCLYGAPVVVDASAGRRALSAALAVMHGIEQSRQVMEASGLIKKSSKI